MEWKDTSKMPEAVQAALGPPKYFINTPDLDDDETYAWFATRGDSMTDNKPHSIPSGSLVLGRWLKIENITQIPLHRPIVVIVEEGNGQQFCMLKSGCGYREVNAPEAAALCLRSYNPAAWCDDFWVPFKSLLWIFVVERVRRPDGSEFVPVQEEVGRTNKPKNGYW